MKITAQEEYGLRCLLQLARQTSLTTAEIAAKEGLSTPYVGKLMTLLRHGELITSERGRSGGFRLAKPAEKISVAQVLDVLGERLFDDPEFCARYAGSETKGNCVHANACTLRSLWSTLHQLTHEVLKRVTIRDLVKQDAGVAALVESHATDVAQGLARPLVELKLD